MKALIPALIVATLSGLATLALPPKRLVQTASADALKEDIALLEADIAVLSNAISSFSSSGGTITDVIPIGINALLTSGDVFATAQDFLSSGTLDPIDAANIVTTGQNLQDEVIGLINQVASKKSLFDGIIPGGALFFLMTFRNLALDLGAAMAGVAPVTVPASTITDLRNELDGAFVAAIAILSG